MNNKILGILSVSAFIITLLSVFVYVNNNKSMPMGNQQKNEQSTVKSVLPLSTHSYAEGVVSPKPGQPIKTFNLIAMEGKNEIEKGMFKQIWGYNGKVPGQEIRVTQGDFVEVTLRNILPEPVTIHWHGYPLNTAMDGVPGINQDAIRTGETFTYRFSADVPGTYWYHSHQQGSKQVDKGLYGALIVEPKSGYLPDKDFTLILDEWTKSDGDMESMEGMSEMESTEGAFTSAEEASMAEEEGMMNMYNIYTVNGKSGDLIAPLDVNHGDLVRLRFINAGYRSHTVHIPGTNIRVVSTDGQEINGAQIVKDKLINISPGERYDIEFTVDHPSSFYIDFHNENKFNDQIKIPVYVNGNSQTFTIEEKAELEVLDLTNYGLPVEGTFTLEEDYDEIYNIDLGIKLKDDSLKYTLNGKTFEELPPINLTIDQLVQITYTNKSNVDHPMHLHGHFFQVIARNGEAVTGATMSKDTLLIKPDESYTIAFRADNPGNWVQHCHELHHAAGGMMQKIIYSDFESNYTPNPKSNFNNPE